MKASLKLAASALGLALASSASAQTVITRSITAEPVETTVTQTPTGTVVTRRPMAQQPALVAPQPTFAAPLAVPPALVQPVAPGPAIVETGPNTIDAITTREVVRRAEAERFAPALSTREVAARSSTRRLSTQRVSTQRTVRHTARVVRATQVTRPAPRLVLAPRERQIVYRTIVEREVMPRQQVIVAPGIAPAPAVVAPAVRPPILAADDIVDSPIAVGTVLPANVPLYAIPENVAISVPATRSYSYAYLDGRAYLVEPASGTIVADVTE